jgi:acetolactate synthase I/II/III large subunit
VSSSRAIAEVLADSVVRRGADRVFGIPGGGSNLDVIGACADRGVPFVLAHAETSAAIMAATYGYATGRPALAVATRGPGCAASVNGAAQATLDRFPLVLCTDGVNAADTRRVAHQYIDQVGLMAPVTKWSGLLGSGDPARVAEAAFEVAAAAPAGAVHLTLDPTTSDSRYPVVARVDVSDDYHLDRAARAVSAARRPVAIVGSACHGWTEEVNRALVHLGCLVLSTYQAVGIFGGDAQFAGLYTGGAIEQPLLDAADLILAVGLDPVEPMPAKWRTGAPVVSLSSVPLDHRYWPEHVDLVGPIGPMLGRITLGVASTDWAPDEGQRRLENALAAMRPPDRGTFGPVEVVDAVRESVPAGTLATVDAGAHFLAVMPWWRASEPKGLLISNGLATMGFALPAAIGLSLARPGRPVVAFTGDGGLSMVLGELETLARLALPVTVVVFDDATLSLIKIKQRPDQGGDAAVRYFPTDIAGVARAMGVEAATVDSAAELRRDLTRGWDRPRLVQARIDPSGYHHLITATRG